MTKRIALLSDIHGNQTALKAVIADLSKQAIDDCWFLGDLVMPGPATNEVFELLENINTSVYIRGNWDDCFLDVQQKKVGGSILMIHRTFILDYLANMWLNI